MNINFFEEAMNFTAGPLQWGALLNFNRLAYFHSLSQALQCNGALSSSSSSLDHHHHPYHPSYYLDISKYSNKTMHPCLFLNIFIKMVIIIEMASIIEEANHFNFCLLHIFTPLHRPSIMRSSSGYENTKEQNWLAEKI